MIVDAHHHVWRIARGDYDWLRPGSPIHRDYSLDDLRPLLGDVTATILVQAAATEAETAFMLEIAAGSSGLVRGVVGWTDLGAANAADRVRAMAANRPLVGLRPMLQDTADTDWVLRPDVRPALKAMADAGLRLDLLIQPRHLPHIPELAPRHPDLPMVIDHGAKPAIAAGAILPWAEHMRRVAADTGVFCKLSGLVTEAGPDWKSDDLRPYVDHLLRCFGPDRLMWGSDWPVVDLAGGLTRWRETALALVPSDMHGLVFGGAAASFYGFGQVTR